MNIRRGVLWDSSAILALLDADDADHQRAATIAGQIASERRPSSITNYIEVEAHALLLRKVGKDARPGMAADWRFTGDSGTSARGGAGPGNRRAAFRQRWSLCDAISFAVLDARGIRSAFTFDRHFLHYSRIDVLGLPR